MSFSMKINLSNEAPDTANFISWKRLVSELRKSGEISEHEEVVLLDVGENGINYFVARTE